MRYLIALLFAACSYAQNTCTPLSVTINGPFGAVTNGLDYLDWGSVRVQWTTNTSSGNPITAFQINYATAAQWASNPNVYPQTQGVQQVNTGQINSNTQIMGGVLSNLLPSTTYHVQPQSSFTTGGNCSVAGGDISFTTPARPAAWNGPVAPIPVTLTSPTLGTHFVYGSSCGTTSGSTPAIITANWQDCLNQAIAVPGSYITAAPGVYPVLQLYLPNNTQWKQLTCSAGSTNTCTQVSGTPPSSGSQVTFYRPPSPVNPGVPYYIINVSGSTFQISADGVNPISFLNTGGTFGGSDIYYMPYPLPQSQWVTIMPSTYGTSALPPAGVRLGPDAIAQYQPNMITFKFMDPTYSDGSLIWGNNLSAPLISSGWSFQNVAFETDPSVAINGNGVDPVGFRVPMEIGGGGISLTSSQGIWFNQCAFLFSTPPSRSGLVPVDGSNIAVTNSYMQGLDWWQGHVYLPYGTTVSNTTSTITFPSQFTVSWPGSDGTVATRHQCNPSGTWQIAAGSLTATGFIWVNPNTCNIEIQTLPGLTVSTTGNVVSRLPVSAPAVNVIGTPGSSTYSYMITATDASGNEITSTGSSSSGYASPFTTITNGNATLSGTNYNALTWSAYSGAGGYNVYNVGGNVMLAHVTTNSYNDQGAVLGGTALYNLPNYLYTSPSGVNTNQNASVFGITAFPIVSGAISGSINSDISYPGSSQQSLTFEVATGFSSGGVGPYLFDNNYMLCGGVCGVFLTDDSTDSTTPCNFTGTPCPIQHNGGNLTETRSTYTTNPCYFYDAACWNGGRYDWRNFSEVKQGKYVKQDGNQYGPMPAQVGLGECMLHETYNGGDSGSASNSGLVITAFPTYTDSNEWQFTNNTCNGTGEEAITGFKNFLTGAPIKNFLVKNNLFENLNIYAQTPSNQPYNSSKVYKENFDGNCPAGQFSNWAGSGQNIVLDHNTTWGLGGCLPTWFGMGADLESGVQYTNNFMNIVTDPGTFSSYQGSIYQSYNTTDACHGNQGNALLTCYNLLNYASNVALFTYTNSLPGSSVEFNNSTISTFNGSSSALPSSGTLIPTGNTLVARLANTGFFSACTLTSSTGCVNNFRLISSSPYISGAHASTDGLDIGVDVNKLEAKQGKVSNVRVLSLTSTSATVAFYMPDSFAASVDWGTTSFFTGSGSWTRVTGAAGSPDPRVQSVSLTGLPAHSLIYYRVNGQVMEPTGSFQLP